MITVQHNQMRKLRMVKHRPSELVAMNITPGIMPRQQRESLLCYGPETHKCPGTHGALHWYPDGGRDILGRRFRLRVSVGPPRSHGASFSVISTNPPVLVVGISIMFQSSPAASLA